MPLATKEAQREYQRAWMAKRREIFFRDKVCVKCGSPKDLTLDHINRASKVSHRIWSWSEQRRIEELKKCQVLCIDCHKKKTRQDFNDGHVVHGTRYRGYQNGCRCKLCCAANTQYWHKS